MTEKWQMLAEQLSLEGEERILNVGTALRDLSVSLIGEGQAARCE